MKMLLLIALACFSTASERVTDLPYDNKLDHAISVMEPQIIIPYLKNGHQVLPIIDSRSETVGGEGLSMGKVPPYKETAMLLDAVDILF